MTDHRLEGPGEQGDPVPRDLPDQQAGPGEDPWEAAPTRVTDDEENAESDEPAADATDFPDTDEAGTGRQGAPQSAAANPEQPVPDEPSG